MVSIGVFFFPAWKSKVCVKCFFGLFLNFFTDKKVLSRTLFSHFSRIHFIFTGTLMKIFTGGQFSISEVKNWFYPWSSHLELKFCFSGVFHGYDLLFTGTFWVFFTGVACFSRALFSVFSRKGFFFSRRKKKTLVSIWHRILDFKNWFSFIAVKFVLSHGSIS